MSIIYTHLYALIRPVGMLVIRTYTRIRSLIRTYTHGENIKIFWYSRLKMKGNRYVNIKNHSDSENLIKLKLWNINFVRILTIFYWRLDEVKKNMMSEKNIFNLLQVENFKRRKKKWKNFQFYLRNRKKAIWKGRVCPYLIFLQLQRVNDKIGQHSF